MTTKTKNRPNKYPNLEQLLRAMRDQLARHLHEHREEAVPERLPDDLAADASLNLLEHLTFDTVERERTTLREIELALERFRSDTYAICENCGNEIPLERLRALPWARFCLRCEQQHERHAAH
jgi:RNA polymerase-binding transcription factor